MDGWDEWVMEEEGWVKDDGGREKRQCVLCEGKGAMKAKAWMGLALSVPNEGRKGSGTTLADLCRAFHLL